jgi:hypothetical protein
MLGTSDSTSEAHERALRVMQITVSICKVGIGRRSLHLIGQEP